MAGATLGEKEFPKEALFRQRINVSFTEFIQKGIQPICVNLRSKKIP